MNRNKSLQVSNKMIDYERIHIKYKKKYSGLFFIFIIKLASIKSSYICLFSISMLKFLLYLILIYANSKIP